MPHPSCSMLTVHESLEVNLDGKIIPYHLKRSARARHARLEIRAETGLTVIVPQNYPRSLAAGIITDKKRWVIAKLDLFRRGKQAYSHDGRHTSYLGRNLKVSMQVCAGPAREAILSGDELTLIVKSGSNGGKNIEDWLKNQAAVIIKETAEKYSLKMGVKYDTLRVRSARTRWGSCSPCGHLSFNWKLILFPLPMIEYVVVHELCHLKEMNHSTSFWKLVESNCPQWRARRKWLRANEGALTI